MYICPYIKQSHTFVCTCTELLSDIRNHILHVIHFPVQDGSLRLVVTLEKLYIMATVTIPARSCAGKYAIVVSGFNDIHRAVTSESVVTENTQETFYLEYWTHYDFMTKSTCPDRVESYNDPLELVPGRKLCEH